MTPSRAQDWLVTDSLTPSVKGGLAPLYEGAARGALAMPFCSTCDRPLELEQVVCTECQGGVPEWRDVEPTGTVHSATTVHRLERSLIRTEHPYHVLDVELSSRHRVIMTTQEATRLPPRIGERVAIGFRNVGGVAVPATLISGSDTEVSP
jgi:uncharacterized OB-fold protein